MKTFGKTFCDLADFSYQRYPFDHNTLTDAFVKKSPILRVLPNQPCSSIANETYQSGMIHECIEVEVKKLQARDESAIEYFASIIQDKVTEMGREYEKYLIYNVLRANPGANIINAGGVYNDNYSILAVRWEEDKVFGLYHPDDSVWTCMPVHGGVSFKNESDELVQALQVKYIHGMLAKGSGNIAGIVNIDNYDNIDLPYMIDDMLSSIRATASGKTMILCHPEVSWTFFDRKIEWNGIPIIPSYNFSVGEPMVVLD